MPDRRPIFMLAFDHRVALRLIFDEFGLPWNLQSVALAKTLALEALERAVAAEPRIGGSAGILVDEEYGSHVALLARRAGFEVAMPVEKSWQHPWELQFGDDFPAHVAAFDPSHLKVLLNYNPDADRSVNNAQSVDLRRLSDWSRSANRSLMVEVLVPPTDEQLASVGGDRRRYQLELLPKLMVRAIEALRADGVGADVWKLEGLDDPADAAAAAAACRTGADHGVRCIVLGRGEGSDQVAEWVRAAVESGAFDGFAIGRTLWKDAVIGHLGGSLRRDEAVELISSRYLGYVNQFLHAHPNPLPSRTVG